MPGYVAEWYGFAATDRSEAAQRAAAQQSCPFVPPSCTKEGGACSVRHSQDIITVCPKRLYGDGHRFLQVIAAEAFEQFGVVIDEASQRPALLSGDRVRAAAMADGRPRVGVFGHGWASEIKLPPAMEGGARYSVDFTLVCVDGDGRLVSFAPIEVQTIDTTNSYRQSLEGLANNREIVLSPKLGMNWENVNKRILPQLIVKGLMLQGERLCSNGIYFVTPEPVYDRVMRRLGGQRRLREIPRQPGSITFVRYQQHEEASVPGEPMPMTVSDSVTISTSDMSLAFITPENLPPAGSYEQMIEGKLKGSTRRR
jgi:hypothetical protein